MKLLSERLKLAMQQKTERDGVEVIPADVARAAKASNTTVNYWLYDVNGMSAAKARLAGEYLDVNPLWLETGKGEMSPHRSLEAPPRPEGWSELTRVDASEHYFLTLYREASEPTKAEMLSQVEELSDGGAELDALPDQQVSAEPKSHARAAPRKAPRKTRQSRSSKTRAGEHRGGK